jgi:hypothetical protein
MGQFSLRYIIRVGTFRYLFQYAFKIQFSLKTLNSELNLPISLTIFPEYYVSLQSAYFNLGLGIFSFCSLQVRKK